MAEPTDKDREWAERLVEITKLNAAAGFAAIASALASVRASAGPEWVALDEEPMTFPACAATERP